MKAKWMLFIAITFLLNSCSGQVEKDNKLADKAKKENIVEPKVDYKVNKSYDENGNLIHYDSTYTYYYSNIDTNSLLKDSIFDKFNQHFNHINPFYNTLFENFFSTQNYTDQDFFREDFFRKDFEKNNERMQLMMEKMDSIKNAFFIEEFPLIDKKDNPSRRK